MKTHILSTRIDEDVYDWLYKMADGKNMSRLIYDILKEAREKDVKRKKRQ